MDGSNSSVDYHGSTIFVIVHNYKMKTWSNRLESGISRTVSCATLIVAKQRPPPLTAPHRPVPQLVRGLAEDAS